ncbi:MAG: hypothetical protein RLZZ416_575 [Candidatus Parcubacteria bacterium]|jgi:GTP cyclohydrolase I
MQEHVRRILRAIGEDPGREGLRNTPKRFEAALRQLTRGSTMDVGKVLKGAIFKEDISEMVLIKNIELYSLCEHHLLPFVGKAHVGYIPDGRIVGLSKVARVVDVFARRLQVQERLTAQIADALYTHLKPLGVGVVIEASHLCMQMRGVEKQDSVAVTSAMRGNFLKSSETRGEFLKLISA